MILLNQRNGAKHFQVALDKVKEFKMLGRRRRLKRDINFSIKRIYDELTTVFNT